MSVIDRPELAIRPGPLPGLFDVDCLRCGRTEVMEGDEPVVGQLAVFHLLHARCEPGTVLLSRRADSGAR